MATAYCHFNNVFDMFNAIEFSGVSEYCLLRKTLLLLSFQEKKINIANSSLIPPHYSLSPITDPFKNLDEGSCYCCYSKQK